MITGFNTDVKHKNRVFHIQTEDKGEQNPYVESLVYVGGEILASKRTSYAEIVRDGRDDHAVQDLMEQQHRTMIAAIQRGRFDGPGGTIRVPEGMSPSAPPVALSERSKERALEKEDEGGDRTAPPGTPAPAKAAGVPDQSLDQMILDYLVSEEVPDDVDLTLSPTPDFVGGRSVQTKLKATSGSPPQPVVGATVQVRILSTVARSTTVFQGKTGADGGCLVAFMVPSFPNGSAAAVIRVTGPGASTEVQYPIQRK